jgi:micrococcal nuclease
VISVIDGDTITVRLAGQAMPVRYIGINAPERDEPCGAEATAANARLVEGQAVMLVRDVSDRDQFDRLLRYVYVADLFVNAALVAQGYAEAAAYPPDTAHDAEFQALEAQARSAGAGCYALEDSEAQGGAEGGAGCDPAYPTVCIPPYPPDLDCGEIGFRRFPVLPPDPHGFDGDGDGIGCQN